MDRPSWWPQHVARLTYMLTTRTAPIVRPRLDVLRAATGEPGAATDRSDSAFRSLCLYVASQRGHPP
jgi:hypothetical protein